MSDYISREAVLEIICKLDRCSSMFAGPKIAMLHSADVEPVVHGRWEKSEYRGFVRCSVCKDAYIDEDWLSSGKWGGCPNCRAKMDLAPPEGDSHG